MADERTFVFDFIVSSIAFNDPNEYNLSDILINVSFLEAKLELSTSNDLEFREGRSLEFKSTQEDLKDSLGVSSIKVYVQKRGEENRYITLDSYIIDWNYRLFEKLENDNFKDYSQLEHQDIVFDGNVIGNIIMGFQINAKEEHLKYLDVDDKKSDNSQRTARTDLSGGDSLKDNYNTSKESVQNDLLFFISDENSSTKIINPSKTDVPFSGPINLSNLKEYQRKCLQHGKQSALELKDSEFSNLSDSGKRKHSSNIDVTKKFKPIQNLEIKSSKLSQYPHSKKRSRGFNVGRSHSNINLKLLNRYVAGGKLNQCEPIDLEDDESFDCGYDLGDCEAALKNLTCNDNFKNKSGNPLCNKNGSEANGNFNNLKTSCNQHGMENRSITLNECGNYSVNMSPQKTFKCTNTAVNRILEEYGTPGDNGGGIGSGIGISVPHLSQILSALKNKYGDDLTSSPKLEATKCLPEDLEMQSLDANSRLDPSCKSRSDKAASYKFKIPLCLTRKPGTSHGKCQRKNVGVPKHMGWLWNLDKEMVSKGWRPGAISSKIKNLMNHFLKDFPADTLPVFRRDRRLKFNRDTLVQKPTLKLKKCNGEYSIVMRPLKTAEDIACSADPYLNMRPIRFTIKKTSNDDCCCDEESDGEFDVEFTPPAGLIKPKLLNRPVIASKETQYSEADFILKTNYEPAARKKYDKIPAFCKEFVKEYNMANRPPCKPAEKKKKGKGAGKGKAKAKAKK